jgi:hypothetical protein
MWECQCGSVNVGVSIFVCQCGSGSVGTSVRRPGEPGVQRVVIILKKDPRSSVRSVLRCLQSSKFQNTCEFYRRNHVNGFHC